MLIRKEKVYVMYISEKEVRLSKAKRLSDLVYFDKKNKRVIIRTTEPMLYKGKHIFFIYLKDPHTFNPTNGKIIEEPVLTLAKEIAKKFKAEIYQTQQVEIENYSPHELTENVISALLDEQFTRNLIQASLEVSKKDIVMYIILIGLGFIIGLLFGWNFPYGG